MFWENQTQEKVWLTGVNSSPWEELCCTPPMDQPEMVLNHKVTTLQPQLQDTNKISCLQLSHLLLDLLIWNQPLKFLTKHSALLNTLLQSLGFCFWLSQAIFSTLLLWHLTPYHRKVSMAASIRHNWALPLYLMGFFFGVSIQTAISFVRKLTKRSKRVLGIWNRFVL